jgi:hypothetical protein
LSADRVLLRSIASAELFIGSEAEAAKYRSTTMETFQLTTTPTFPSSIVPPPEPPLSPPSVIPLEEFDAGAILSSGPKF